VEKQAGPWGNSIHLRSESSWEVAGSFLGGRGNLGHLAAWLRHLWRHCERYRKWGPV